MAELHFWKWEHYKNNLIFCSLRLHFRFLHKLLWKGFFALLIFSWRHSTKAISQNSQGRRVLEVESWEILIVMGKNEAANRPGFPRGQPATYWWSSVCGIPESESPDSDSQFRLSDELCHYNSTYASLPFPFPAACQSMVCVRVCPHMIYIYICVSTHIHTHFHRYLCTCSDSFQV